jgi:hypothetical protein
MIDFKENIEELLPYDRREYIEYLDDDSDSISPWYGTSIQLDSSIEKADLAKTIEIFEPLFRRIILGFKNGPFWIANHDDKDLNWFPNNSKNLKSLRNLFEQNGIENTYRGALIFTNDMLFSIDKDLISYSYVLSYKNIDISHSELPFVIKMTSHLTIDLLSTDQRLLKEIINKEQLDSFILKKYRGSSF